MRASPEHIQQHCPHAEARYHDAGGELRCHRCDADIQAFVVTAVLSAGGGALLMLTVVELVLVATT